MSVVALYKVNLTIEHAELLELLKVLNYNSLFPKNNPISIEYEIMGEYTYFFFIFDTSLTTIKLSKQFIMFDVLFEYDKIIKTYI